MLTQSSSHHRLGSAELRVSGVVLGGRLNFASMDFTSSVAM